MPIAITIICILISAAALGFLAAYRRQIRKIKRQLEFLRENESVMRVTYDMPFKEVDGLCCEINEFIDKIRADELKIKRGDAALREAIANISHDIRTPLTSLDGYFRQLKNCKTEEESERYYKIIDGRVTALKDLLDELFTYAKLQDEQFSPEMEDVDLGKLVYDSAFSFYDDFVSAGIEPAIDVCGGHTVVIGNEDGMRRIISNIIKNALVHSRSEVKISLKTDGEKAVLICENNAPHGTEIDPERIFDRFYKADKARTTGSTGLGLSIAKGLTERMGGEISAEYKDEIFRITIIFKVHDA